MRNYRGALPYLVRSGPSAPRRQRALASVLAFSLSIAAALIFGTDKTQSPVWLGPFLSAAANVDFGAPLRIDRAEVEAFADLAIVEREDYLFLRSEETSPYTYNDVGFAYIVYAAKHIFPFLGDQAAVEALQILVHALITATIVYLLPSLLMQSGFVLLYGINPVVIYFATFPFYYFWQVIPTFALVLVLLRREQVPSAPAHPPTALGRAARTTAIVALCGAIGIVVLARPSTLPIALFTFVVALVTLPWRKTVVFGALIAGIVVAVAFVPPDRNFWHTVYVGTGAHPNPFGLEILSDDVGYELYERETGTPLVASLGGNLYDPEVMADYRAIARAEYLSMVAEKPWLFVRNAIVNGLQAYAVGYVNGAPAWIQSLTALAGFAVIAALLFSRQYLLFVAIGIASGSFTLYFPPIQAYMYGSFVLIVLGALRFLTYVAHRRFPNRDQPDGSADAPWRR